jgi:hypothetical protein
MKKKTKDWWSLLLLLAVPPLPVAMVHDEYRTKSIRRLPMVLAISIRGANLPFVLLEVFVLI